MILTKNIIFKNFIKIKKEKKLKKKLDFILKSKNEILSSLSKNYKYSFSNKIINNFKKNISSIRLIGIGGSILGTKAIYNFLSHKVKKKIFFINNLTSKTKYNSNKDILNIVVSKSGNTLETIVNTNILIKKIKKIFLLQKIKIII